MRKNKIYYCPFDITCKDIFCLAFYFKWKYFVLIDHISSETIRFSFSVFCSQILTQKLNLWPKIGPAYAISIVKGFSVIFVQVFFFFFFFTFLCWNWIINVSQQYCENFTKKMNKQNLLKICLSVTYPTDFCIICIHFYHYENMPIQIYWKF